MQTPQIVKDEPVATTSLVTALVGALIALLVSFGVDISADQKVAILGFLAAAAPLVGLLARRYVTPISGFVRGEGKHRREV